jgi:uncharacterized phage-like protein YoqJ
MRTTKTSVRKEYNEYVIDHIQGLLNFYEENNIKKNKKTLEEMLSDAKSSNDEKILHKIAEHLEILINFSEFDYGYKHKIK